MSGTPADEPLRWIKSTRSAGSGECVEVARTAMGVAVRDSKAPGPMLRFGAGDWTVFIEDIRAGKFDYPDVS